MFRENRFDIMQASKQGGLELVIKFDFFEGDEGISQRAAFLRGDRDGQCRAYRTWSRP